MLLFCERVFTDTRARLAQVKSAGGGSPVCGSAGRSDSLLLDDTEDFRGTGKNPRRKSATPTTSHIKMNEANTDERTFILLVGTSFFVKGTSAFVR